MSQMNKNISDVGIIREFTYEQINTIPPFGYIQCL